jgi:eukaryotic-like serine/threonine-protein kinase
VAIFDPVSRKSVVILQRAAYGRYSSTGQLLFIRGRALMSADFDLEKTEARGAPHRIADAVATHPWVGGGHFAVGPDGTVVVVRGSWGSFKTSSFWVDRSGQPLAAPRLSESELGKPRISPDGSRAVFDGVSAQGDGEIYIADLVRGTTVRFTTDSEDDFNPVWTADGRRIIWSTLPAGKMPTLVWRAADGTGATETILGEGGAQFAGSVSIDNVFAFTRCALACDIWVVPLTGERKPRVFVDTPAAEFGPEFSPDGKWIAYVSNESGTPEVYVVPFPGPGGKRRVTTGGGAAVSWSRDGRELYYQSGDRLVAIPVLDATEMRLGEPHVLFKGNFVTSAREDGPREYDVALGGKRFLVVQSDKTTAPPAALEVLSHWWLVEPKR